MNRVSIFGLGLIGGSLALALRGRGIRVAGIERGDVLGDVRVQGLTDSVIDTADDRAVREAYAASDLVVLCAPIAGIRSELARALSSGTIVTDVGSTKREIVRDAGGATHFVAGHPLAGGSQSRGDLFLGQRWILCPEGASQEALQRVEDLVAHVGGELVHMTAEAHDRALALTSHLPQLLASALVSLSERHQSRLAEGPGFASTTRIAGGNPEIWGDIFATNRDFLASAIDELIAELTAVRESLGRGEADAALSVIQAARRLRGGATRGSR